jgi:hypothetical protein
MNYDTVLPNRLRAELMREWSTKLRSVLAALTEAGTEQAPFWSGHRGRSHHRDLRARRHPLLRHLDRRLEQESAESAQVRDL